MRQVSEVKWLNQESLLMVEDKTSRTFSAEDKITELPCHPKDESFFVSFAVRVSPPNAHSQYLISFELRFSNDIFLHHLE